MLVLDDFIAEWIKTDRAARGIDGHDEAWDGTWIVMPSVDDCHQELITNLATVVQFVLGWGSKHRIFPGINVSDRTEGWTWNVRCPDFAVYLQDNPAQACGTHFCGGPDFLAEIMTPGDMTRDKLPFYASVNTSEVMVIDRDPWRVELHQLQNGRMVRVGESTLARPDVLTSSVLPLTFRLIPGTDRPQIEVTHTSTGQVWLV